MTANLLSDRELLELAAKAHGNIKLYNDFLRDMTRGGYEWNPLKNDGDAFRLQVQLSFRVYVYAGAGDNFTIVACDEAAWKRQIPNTREDHGSDPYAATRRAIVRAAAEIGGRMAI